MVGGSTVAVGRKDLPSVVLWIWRSLWLKSSMMVLSREGLSLNYQSRDFRADPDFFCHFVPLAMMLRIQQVVQLSLLRPPKQTYRRYGTRLDFLKTLNLFCLFLKTVSLLSPQSNLLSRLTPAYTPVPPPPLMLWWREGSEWCSTFQKPHSCPLSSLHSGLDAVVSSHRGPPVHLWHTQQP